MPDYELGMRDRKQFLFCNYSALRGATHLFLSNFSLGKVRRTCPVTLFLLTLSLFSFLLLGCATAAVTAVPTLVPTTLAPTALVPQLAPVTLPPSRTLRPTSTAPVPVPTRMPTLQPTAILSKTVAVPLGWPVLESLTVPGWQVVVSDQPRALFESGAAEAALLTDGTGPLLWQTPIALAVPWTTAWEEISLEEAQHIVQFGHDQVEIMLWSEMGPRQKPLRINGRFPSERHYPLQRSLSLVHHATVNVSLLETAVRQSLPPEKVVHLTAVGDIMLDRRLGAAIKQGHIDFPFAAVAPHFQQADFVLGNLESALGHSGTAAHKSYPFRAPAAAAVSLAQAGFDLLTLANNHGMDYGPDGLLEGLALLAAQKLATIGAGQNKAEARAPHLVEINGLTVAFLAYVNVPIENSGFDTRTWRATENEPGLAWAEPATLAADVTAVAATADLLIVVLHSGFEYIANPSPAQTDNARAAIDAGADLIIGHHAHILQGVEYYKDGVIVYGLGNFAFDIDGAPETAVLDVWLDSNGVRQLSFKPAIVQPGGQPRFAQAEESEAILHQLYFLTNLLNPP